MARPSAPQSVGAAGPSAAVPLSRSRSLALPASAALGPAVACAAALIVPLAYVPALVSVFAEPKLALLSVAGALGLGNFLWQWGRGSSVARPRLPPGLSAAMVALVATTALAAGAAPAHGSPGAPYAGVEIGRLLAVVGIALASAQAMSDPRWRQRLLSAVQVAGGLVSLIGLLQHLQIWPFAIPIISVPGSTFGNRNIAAEAVAMSIPFGLGALALARRPGRAGVERRAGAVSILGCLALELIYLGATRTRGAWLGAACAIAVFYLLRRRAVSGAALGVALALAAATLAAALIPGRAIPRDFADAKRFESGEHVVREALDSGSPVVRARLGLWRRTLAMYRDHPLFGVGPGNFAVYFPRYAEPGARADGVLSATVAPRRAHDDLIERLAETGPLGLGALLAVYAVAAAMAIRGARRADGAGRRDGAAPPSQQEDEQEATRGDEAALAAAGAGSLAALLVCGLTGFPLAMPATALLFGIALGCLARGGGRRAPDQPAAPRDAAPDVAPPAAPGSGARRLRAAAAGLIAVLIVAGATVGAARALLRSYGLARARVALRTRTGASAALAALARADRIDPGRFDVALELAFTLVRLGRFGDAVGAADRALAVEPYSPNAWALRAEAALGAGDARRAADDARAATTLLADHPDALATRARAEARLGDQPAARAARVRLAALAGAGDRRAQRLLAALGPETETDGLTSARAPEARP